MRAACNVFYYVALAEILFELHDRLKLWSDQTCYSTDKVTIFCRNHLGNAMLPSCLTATSARPHVADALAPQQLHQKLHQQLSQQQLQVQRPHQLHARTYSLLGLHSLANSRWVHEELSITLHCMRSVRC